MVPHRAEMRYIHTSFKEAVVVNHSMLLKYEQLYRGFTDEIMPIVSGVARKVEGATAASGVARKVEGSNRLPTPQWKNLVPEKHSNLQ